MTVKRGTIVLFGARIGVSAVGFAATVYFARTLGQSALGIYFTYEAVINVLGIFSRFGINSAVEKRISEASPENDEYLGSALALATLPLLLVLGVAIAFSQQINAYIGAAATVALIAGVVSSNYSSVLLSALRGEGKLVESAALELFSETLRVLISVGLLFEGMGAVALLYGFVAGIGGRAIVSGALLKTGLTLPSREKIVSLISFSRYAVVANVKGLAYSWFDTLLLSYLLTKGIVGVYESAWKISVVVLLASTAIGTALFPAFSRWHSEGRVEYIESAVTEGITFTLVLIIPATVGAVLLGNEIMQLVYHFSTGGIILAILVGEKLFQSIVEILQRVFLGIDQARSVFYINITALSANIILNIIFINYIGAIGAAVATLSCSFVSLVLSYWSLRSYITIRPNWYTLGWEVMAALIMGGMIVILNGVVEPSSLPALGLVILAGAVIYSGIIILNPSIRRSIRSAVL